jgi:beta-lactamase superfamily II metal-dependent hydrolase
MKKRIFGNITITVLNPLTDSQHMPNEDQGATNNNSLVLRISYGEVSFLFAADILHERESKLVQEGAALSATVLKIPHHGGQSSSSEAFLRAVQPSVAIVSGRSFGKRQTPHPIIKKRLEQLGIDTYVTEQSGALTIKTDGKIMEIHPYKNISPS